MNQHATEHIAIATATATDASTASRLRSDMSWYHRDSRPRARFPRETAFVPITLRPSLR